MNHLIVPDLHEKVEIFERIERAFPGTPKVFLGDAYDSFDSTPERALATAQLHKRILNDPEWTVLMGDHDAQYRWGNVPELSCTGMKQHTRDAIAATLTDSDWSRARLTHRVGKWLLSHAGLTAHLAAMPPEVEQQVIQRLNAGYTSAWLMAGWDWDLEFRPIPRVNQIVGHTRHDSPQWEFRPDSENWCIDTDLRHVALIDKESIEIVEVARL